MELLASAPLQLLALELAVARSSWGLETPYPQLSVPVQWGWQGKSQHTLSCPTRPSTREAWDLAGGLGQLTCSL